METRNSGLLIHIRTKSTHPLGFTNVDGKVKLRRMKMNQINNSKKKSTTIEYKLVDLKFANGT